MPAAMLNGGRSGPRPGLRAGTVDGTPEASSALRGAAATAAWIALAFCLSCTPASAQDPRQPIADWPLWIEVGPAEPAPVQTDPNFGAFDPRKHGGGAPDGRPSLRWTRAALDFIVYERLNPLRAARVLAILHAAMHDALVRGVRQANDDGVAWIAVHRAASLVLADLFPEQSAERLEALGLVAAAGVPGAATEKGLAMWALGAVVARDAAARARRDGSDRVWPLEKRPASTPGRWRPTPPINSANPLEPLAGEWRPWVLSSGAAVEPPPPIAYGSRRFWEEVEEVRRITSTLTPAQKATAEKWNLDQGTVTPAGVWNLMAIDLALGEKVDAPQTVRMFAAMNVAMLDAFIACWHVKYKWWTVRPISVIRERDDPEFLSYLLTPAFPSYVSGHAAASAAAATVLVRFVPARADWLGEQALEAAESRLLGGIHYRSDNEEGLKLGQDVGHRVLGRGSAQAR